MANWGLLQGLGQGMNQVGDFMMRSRADELKEQRLQQYRMEAEQRQNAHDDSIRAAERTNKLADIADERKYEASQAAVKEEVTRKGNKQITIQRNAEGKVIGRKEEFLDPEKSKGFSISNGFILDKDTGEYQKVEGYEEEMTDQQKLQIKSLDSDIASFRQANGDPDTIWQLEQERNRLLGRAVDDNAISPAKDEGLRAKAETMADEWVKEQAGWISTKDDFKDYGGNKAQARAAKAEEFYQQMRGNSGQQGLLQPRQEQSSSAKASDKPAPDAMADMPDPAQHKGRMIRDDETGQMYKSDGKTWKPL